MAFVGGPMERSVSPLHCSIGVTSGTRQGAAQEVVRMSQSCRTSLQQLTSAPCFSSRVTSLSRPFVAASMSFFSFSPVLLIADAEPLLLVLFVAIACRPDPPGIPSLPLPPTALLPTSHSSHSWD
eukprot:m.124791 g.124791  ORF g.124791 m.124791 type:complete len:125 (+) comp9678_c0_seq7:1816-2190(+)